MCGCLGSQRAGGYRSAAPLTQEEVARLPVHMRREEECERRLLPQHLAMRLDGAPVIADTVRAAGALGDRPLYVNPELRVDPGTHSLSVEFLGAGEVGDASASAGTRLALDTVLTLSPREITVITLSPAGAMSLTRTGPSPSFWAM